MAAEANLLIGTYNRAAVVIASGRGCTLYDVEGKEYLDMASSIAVNALGHGDEDWVNAVTQQANILTHVSNVYYSVPQWMVLSLIVFSFQTLETEANEAAIKFARKYQRFSHPDEKQPATEFISFTNSFHGRTMGALALTIKNISFLEYGNIKAVKEAILRGKTAAVFVEPIHGEGGIYSATKEFLQSLRDACDAAGALLVFDEVQCGLGRTGCLWANEMYDVFPDIMTLAKPLAGGLPIGAVLMTDKVASAANYGDHGSTFAGSPLVCNAAVAVFDKVTKPGFLASVTKKREYLKELLSQKLGGNKHIKEIRGTGLIVGVELDVSASHLVDACRNSGLLILTAGKGNVVRIIPPLVISEQELEHGVNILSKCMSAIDES
ncbi:hypothetical protein MKX01_011621 [Papaver californicum]|nr:hypothetical protein MKX01_011621 [Papaver californicum]